MKLAVLAIVLGAVVAHAAPSVVTVEIDRAGLQSTWSDLVPSEAEPGGLLVPPNADPTWWKVGLQAGDIVRFVNGDPATSLDSLRDGLQVLDIERRGQRVLVRVVIHGPASDTRTLSESDYQDIVDRLADPDPRTTPMRDKDGPSGVRITDLLITLSLDYEIGDIVRTIGGQPIRTNAEFVAAMRKLPVGATEIIVERLGRRVALEIIRAAPVDLTTIERLSSTRFDIDRATFDALQEDPALLTKKIETVPLMSRGVMTGLRVYKIQKDSLAAALGLENDDILLELEGRTVGSLDSLYAAKSHLYNARQVTVTLERKRKRIAITYAIR